MHLQHPGLFLLSLPVSPTLEEIPLRNPENTFILPANRESSWNCCILFSSVSGIWISLECRSQETIFRALRGIRHKRSNFVAPLHLLLLIIIIYEHKPAVRSTGGVGGVTTAFHGWGGWWWEISVCTGWCFRENGCLQIEIRTWINNRILKCKLIPCRPYGMAVQHRSSCSHPPLSGELELNKYPVVAAAAAEVGVLCSPE